MNTKTALHANFNVQTISENGQFRPNGVSICFWNQGTTEVVIDSNIRLAPATLDTATGTYRGGEAFTFEHPTGRMIVSTFQFTFNPTSVSPQINQLRVQWLYDVDNDDIHH